MKQYFIYILASKQNGTLYIGSTSNLQQRIWQHKNDVIPSFTKKYDVHKLVYYEEQGGLSDMMMREKQLKKWCRVWKLDLIEAFNPAWEDLYEKLFV